MPLHNPEPPAGGVAGFLVRRDAACAEIFLPTAPPAIVTSGAGIYIPGAAVLLGSHAQDLYPSYCHIVNYLQASAMVDQTVRLKHGLPSAYFDSMREIAPFFNPGPTTAWALPLSMMMCPHKIPALDNIYAESMSNDGGVYSVAVILLAWAGGLPPFDVIPFTTTFVWGSWLPNDASDIGYNIFNGAGYVYGPSTTITAVMGADTLIVGLKMLAQISMMGVAAELYQVGYGPAGGETWVATSSHGRTWCERWIWPPVLVKAGERLAVRGAGPAAVHRFVQLKYYTLA
jgi:hypothetical protein